MSLNNSADALNGLVSCSEISAATIVMKDNLLQLHANDNHIGAGYSFDNHSDNETKGEFIVRGDISREEDNRIFDIRIMPSSLQYNAKEWSIQPSDIHIHNGSISIDSFGAISGEQSISLHGTASENPGYIQLDSPVIDKALTIDMLCDSSYVANLPLGVMRLGMNWDETLERFDIFANNDLKGRSNIDLSGHFSPKTKGIHADITLDRLETAAGFPLTVRWTE